MNGSQRLFGPTKKVQRLPMALDGSTLALNIGDRIGPFLLLAQIARGGMGEVWLAKTDVHSGVFALKTILSDLATELRVRQAFIDEVRLAARIMHPNIVQVISSGEESGRLYVAMEYLEGETLRTLIGESQKKKANLPVELCVFMIAEACLGLQAAHDLKDETNTPLSVVHRDITPHNLFLTTEGEVKVIDFGIAKARGRLSAETTIGTIKGKVDYMAPEQVSGEKIDKRADIYGLGATLYALLSGHPPYCSVKEGQVATLSKLIRGVAPPSLPTHVPDFVKHIVLKSMARNPSHRYQSCNEMRDDLVSSYAEYTNFFGAPTAAKLLVHYCFQGLESKKKAILEANTQIHLGEEERLKFFIHQKGESKNGIDRTHENDDLVMPATERQTLISVEEELRDKTALSFFSKKNLRNKALLGGLPISILLVLLLSTAFKKWRNDLRHESKPATLASMADAKKEEPIFSIPLVPTVILTSQLPYLQTPKNASVDVHVFSPHVYDVTKKDTIQNKKASSSSLGRSPKKENAANPRVLSPDGF